jgi:molybdopterin-guanine dinucleotide biosynthesis protein A
MSITASNIIGCVLAGGQSRRMGGHDKAFAQLAGRPLAEHVIARLAPQVRSVAINSNGAPAAYSAFKVPVFPDVVTGFAGPLAGIHAATLHAAALPGVTHVITAAADTPFLPADLVRRLAAAVATPQTIALAASAGRVHPVIGLWPVALADELGLWLLSAQTLSVRAWTEGQETVTVPFSADGPRDPFFNINTPEDLATAARAIAGQDGA